MERVRGEFFKEKTGEFSGGGGKSCKKQRRLGEKEKTNRSSWVKFFWGRKNLESGFLGQLGGVRVFIFEA